jgi:hypothetical protein
VSGILAVLCFSPQLLSVTSVARLSINPSHSDLPQVLAYVEQQLQTSKTVISSVDLLKDLPKDSFVGTIRRMFATVFFITTGNGIADPRRKKKLPTRFLLQEPISLIKAL